MISTMKAAEMARARRVHRPENCRAYFAGLLPVAVTTISGPVSKHHCVATTDAGITALTVTVTTFVIATVFATTFEPGKR